MNKFISNVRFRVIFTGLVFAILITAPSVLTWSKYVWEENITLNLKVNLNTQQDITGMAFMVSNVTGILDGKGIKLEETETYGQWMLSPEKGYTLPETILVRIGDTEYTVNTNGQKNEDAITFDPEKGLLTITNSLLSDSKEKITIIANAVKKE